MGGHRNAGRRGRRPLRRKWNCFDLSEPLCHPTLAAPLPPSYEEGAPRRGRLRFFEPVPITHLFCPSLREGCPSEAMGKVGASISPACVIRRRGRRLGDPPPDNRYVPFIGTAPVPPRATGGHMGPPIRGMWKGIPFNRHRRSSKRGSPGRATPTAFIGGNPNPATRAARSGGPYRARCPNGFDKTNPPQLCCRGRHSWRPARSKFRLPTAPVTLNGLEYPAAAAAPLFPKKGSRGIRLRRFAPPL